MKTKLGVVIFLAANLVAPSMVWAAPIPTTTATGIYDETTSQTNNVDFNATGNSNNASTGNGAAYSTIGTFNSLVNTAFLAGRGGVVTFDSLSGGRPQPR